MNKTSYNFVDKEDFCPFYFDYNDMDLIIDNFDMNGSLKVDVFKRNIFSNLLPPIHVTSTSCIRFMYEFRFYFCSIAIDF